METFDLYTPDGVKSGRTMIRGTKIPEGYYRVIIHVIIFNSKGEMLIQQRQPFKKGWSGLWDLTVGGAVTAGETSAQAVVRELEEELGIVWDLQGEPPALTVTFDHGFDDIYLLRGEVDVSTLCLQPSEVAQAKWADREEVFAMMADGRFVPYHESLVELLFAMRKRTDGLREE